MWIGSGKVKDRFIALSPKRALDLIGTHAHTVVANVVLELTRLFRDEHTNNVLHGVVVALQHRIHGRVQDVITKALCQLDHPLGCGVTGSNQSVQIEAVPLRRSHVVQNELEEIFLQHPLFVELGRRNTDAFLENCCRLNRNRARHHAAVVGHMAKHRRPCDVTAIPKDGYQHHPIGKVRYCGITKVRIVCEDDVTLFDLGVVGAQERADKRAKLSHDHLPFDIGNHGEAVALLADAG